MVCFRSWLSLCDIDDCEKQEENVVFVKFVYCVLCTEKSSFSIMHIYTFCLDDVARYIYTNSFIENCNKYT